MWKCIICEKEYEGKPRFTCCSRRCSILRRKGSNQVVFINKPFMPKGIMNKVIQDFSSAEVVK